MKLNQIPNLRTEDFPSEQSWIGRLFTQLNPFIQAVNQVVNHNIDFSSNIRSLTRVYSITYFQEFNIQWPYPETPPLALSIVKASVGDQSTPTCLLASWKYDFSASRITVTSLIEVTHLGNRLANGIYNFTLRASL